MKNELITVIIPTYNREKTIIRSIESVLKQTYKNFEIIIVDDNSTDNTAEKIKNYINKYSNIKYIKHSINKGGSAARNTGANMAKGKYLAFLDSDDEWLERKLEKQVIEFEKNDKVALVYTSFRVLDEKSGNIIRIHKNTKYDDILIKLLYRNVIGTTSSILVKKECFDEVNGFNENFLSCQDLELYIKLALKYEFGCVEDILLNYYVHNKSISCNLDNLISGQNLLEEMIEEIAQKRELIEIKKNNILAKRYNQIGKIYIRFSDYKNARVYFKKSYELDNKIEYFIKGSMNDKALKCYYLTLQSLMKLKNYAKKTTFKYKEINKKVSI